jgi:uncharacterized membrane protein YphA (DoxX/SURF4 family)
MDTMFLLGRVLFGGYFVYNGANHLLSTAMLAQYAASKGVPAPELAVAASGLLILIGGASILLGWWPHIGVLCITLFLAIVTPVMHNFWAATDAGARTADLLHFAKNTALLGGTLTLLGVPRPWPYSIEQQRTITA